MRYPFLDLGAVNDPFMAELHEAACRVIDSGRYIGGKEVSALEDAMREMCGCGHAVGVSNGLDALTLILRAYVKLGRLHEGDGVIVPANTYIASMLAVTNAGLKIVPVDVDERTMNLSASAAANAVTPEIKAMMVVHLYGRNAWDEQLRELAVANGLIVIEDAAQAIGCRSDCRGINGGNMVGALGHAAGFSFYPTKNIGALGDGGMVTTDDGTLADAVRALANYGSDRRYHNVYRGYNCRLDPIQAAMVSVKLRHISHINSRRRQNAATYDRHIANRSITKPLMPVDPMTHVWHQYVVDAGARRESFMRHLDAHGVGCDIHYAVPPMHQPCYAGMSRMHFPITDRLASGIVSLPISEATSTEDIIGISRIINQFSPQTHLCG